MSDTFKWPIYGHKNQINFLQDTIAKDKFSNAYLFYGAKGLGKKFTADFFVKSLFCKAEDNKPCHKCKNCQMVKNRTLADLYSLGHEEGDLSVENIRDFLRRLSLSRSGNKRKIAIIYKADKINIFGANALLKTLEEPPQNTSLILVANSIDNMPATVISRCQLIKFQALLREDMMAWLNNFEFSKLEKETIMNLSFGRPGLALKLMNDNLASYKKSCTFLIKLLSSAPFYYMQTIDKWFQILKTEYPGYKLYELGQLTSEYLDLFEVILRDLLWIKLDRPIVNKLYEKELLKLAENFETDKLMNNLFYIDDCKKQMQQNVSPQLLWENLFLKLK